MQDASSAWDKETRDREVLKNELLFCSNSEVGWQSLKVALLRKALKKLGQPGAVKLSPSEVSKGLGSADGGPAVADAVSMLDVALPVEVVFADIVFVGATTRVLWIEMAEPVSVAEAIAETSDSEVGVAVEEAAVDPSGSEIGVANGAAVEPKGSAFSCL